MQIAGAPENTAPTIAYAAERLGLKHNSAVELADRCEREGFLTRLSDKTDKRRAILVVTRKGKQMLNKLSADHANELTEMAPRLLETLGQIQLQTQKDATTSQSSSHAMLESEAAQ